jgi:hypothetical protein
MIGISITAEDPEGDPRDASGTRSVMRLSGCAARKGRVRPVAALPGWYPIRKECAHERSFPV